MGEKELDLHIEGDRRKVDFIDTDFVIYSSLLDAPINTYPVRVEAVIMFVCVSGKGTVGVNLRQYELKEGSMILAFPEQIIMLKERTPDFSCMGIGIASRFLGLQQLGEFLPMVLYITEHSMLDLKEDEKRCMMEYLTFLRQKVRMVDNYYRKDVTRNLLLAMFYDVFNIFRCYMPNESVKPRSRKEELFERFLTEVNKHYREERQVAFYAEQLCVTPKHLSGTVKLVSGRTAGEWIDRFVVLEARALLKSSDKSIQEISEELHFANQSFFGKYFKHFVGMSPKEYRRS